MKYPSRYSNGKSVSSAQYITELICEHKARLNKLDLHYKFWVNKEWAKYYRNQIATANQLVKKYNAKSIIKALNDKRAEKIYSLRAPHLIDIIEQYESVQEDTNIPQVVVDRSSDKTYRQTKKSNNILSKLKELDNGDES